MWVEGLLKFRFREEGLKGEKTNGGNRRVFGLLFKKPRRIANNGIQPWQQWHSKQRGVKPGRRRPYYLRNKKRIAVVEEAMDISKKVITKEEWEKKLSDVKIRKEDMNRLLMDFLVIEGYVDVAEKFRVESGTEPDLDLTTIKDRLRIEKSVQCGNIEDAIEKVNDFNPEKLDTNPKLCFVFYSKKMF